MATFKPTEWKAIRKAIVTEWDKLYNRKDYEALGASWGVSAGTVHRIVFNLHTPSDARIKAALLASARKKGIVQHPDKRIRIELSTAISDKDLVKIRKISKKERAEILIGWIKFNKHIKGKVSNDISI